MKRFFSVCAALTASLALSGCVPNEMSIEILYGLKPAVEEDGRCTADFGADFLASGFLDVGATNARLSQAFAARNNMGNNADESSERLNSRDFLAEQGVVSYTTRNDQELKTLLENLGDRETPMAVTIQAGQESGIWIDVITRTVATLLADSDALSDPSARVTIIVNTRIEGHTQDGSLLSSSTLAFPVEVCNGCLFCPDGSEPLLWSCSEGSPPQTCTLEP